MQIHDDFSEVDWEYEVKHCPLCGVEHEIAEYGEARFCIRRPMNNTGFSEETFKALREHPEKFPEGFPAMAGSLFEKVKKAAELSVAAKSPKSSTLPKKKRRSESVDPEEEFDRILQKERDKAEKIQIKLLDKIDRKDCVISGLKDDVDYLKDELKELKRELKEKEKMYNKAAENAYAWKVEAERLANVAAQTKANTSRAIATQQAEQEAVVSGFGRVLRRIASDVQYLTVKD